MAQPSTPSAPPPAHTTLLGVLKAFTKAQETRASLQHELEDALSSFLSGTPSPITNLIPTGPTPVSASTCATEAVRPPNQDELGEVLRIGFTGILEVRQEVDTLQAVLRVVFKRDDLADVLEKVEQLEGDRLKEVRSGACGQSRGLVVADRARFADDSAGSAPSAGGPSARGGLHAGDRGREQEVRSAFRRQSPAF